MKKCGIYILMTFFLFCVPSWAQEDLNDRDMKIAQALKDFEMSWEESGEVQETVAPLDWEAEDNQDEDLLGKDLSQRVSRIKDALEKLEQAQLPLDEESDEDVDIENVEEYPDESTLSPEESSYEPSMVIHGSFRNEIAHHIYKPYKFSKFNNQFALSARGEILPSVRYRISGWTYYDAAYDFGDYYSDSARSDQRFETELRDTYIDYSFGPWDLRLGKQQVVWGEAVGVFVADVVNAKDLRELNLPDLDSIRIPEWGMNLEYTKNDFHSEFVLLPGIEFDRIGVTGSEFAFPLPLPPNTPATYRDAKAPKDGFENSKVGTRLSYLWQGLDVGVFYLHSWTSTPVLYRTINAGVYDFDPAYRRLNIIGTTVSKEFNDIVFKGDFVYTKDNYFPVLDPIDSDGIVKSSHWDYLLGADYTFFNRLDVNAQFIQRVIVDHTDTMLEQDKYNSSVSLRLSRNFWNRKLQTEILTIYGLSDSDFLYQPKATYNLTDNWQARVGVDIFAGQSSGTLGYFRNKSRYYSQLTYKF